MRKPLLSALALTAMTAFAAAPASAEITIGVAAPITGPNAAFGAQIQRGAEKAVADLNAAGGNQRRADPSAHRRRRFGSASGRLGGE